MLSSESDFHRLPSVPLTRVQLRNVGTPTHPLAPQLSPRAFKSMQISKPAALKESIELRRRRPVVDDAISRAEQLDFALRVKALKTEPSKMEFALAAKAKTHANFLAIKHAVQADSLALRASSSRDEANDALALNARHNVPTSGDLKLIRTALEHRNAAISVLDHISLLRAHADAALSRGACFRAGTPQREASANAAESLLIRIQLKRAEYNDLTRHAEELEFLAKGKVVGA